MVTSAFEIQMLNYKSKITWWRASSETPRLRGLGGEDFCAAHNIVVRVWKNQLSQKTISKSQVNTSNLLQLEKIKKDSR